MDNSPAVVNPSVVPEVAPGLTPDLDPAPGPAAASVTTPEMRQEAADALARTPNYLGRAVGSFATGFFEGMPLDWAKDQVLTRAGVPHFDPDASPDAKDKTHPLRKDLVYTHASEPAGDIRRLPTPFPPEGYDPEKDPLSTAEEWLAYLEKVARVPPKAKGDK